MISLKELNPHGYSPSEEQAANLQHLYEVMNIIRAAYGKPMIITSGLRTLDDQKKIDRHLLGPGGKPKGPRKSQHLLGNACDVSDPTGELYWFCLDHMDLIHTLGVYLEDKSFTPRWVHFQTVPPRSGNRIFLP